MIIICDFRKKLLVHIGFLSNWIGSAMVHIVAQHIAAAGKFDQRHCLNTLGRNKWTRFIANLHTSSHFTISDRIFAGIEIHWLHRDSM
ncbi:hypothetical protein D3C78_1588520 [compost metagenome]